MIPILYESDETEFISNGLGRLSDAISCIAEEERNGAYELTMEYPVYGIHYAELQNTRIISAVPSDGKGKQPFDIYDISRPISGKVVVKARHISYRLSKIPTYSAEPETMSTSAAGALQRIKNEAVEYCPFDFWTDQDSSGSYNTPIPSSIRSRLGGVTGSILDCFGGEYEWDGWTVKLHKQRGSDAGVTLRYGKNITDITQEESIENTVTGVLPYWHKEADSEEAKTVVGDITRSDNAERYPYHMTMILDCSQDFQTEPTKAQLNAKADAYIKVNNVGVPDVSIKVSFAALWQAEEYKTLASLERVHLCDTLRVEFPALGVSATAKVVKTTYNVLKNRYDSIEIGNARTNLADQITGTSKDTEIRQKQSLSFLQEALARSTKLIQGGLGGHVVINTDGDGKPNEILIMDTDDTATASKVLRINMNGIGFSSKGYEGPFSTAWTIDGVFNADYINAGTIRANMIKSGILSDKKGLNYWDLETGEFNSASINEKTESLSARIKQTAKDISLTVNNGTKSSGIIIKVEKEDGTTEELKGQINMDGLVSFTDLSTAGKTTISGDNITTGKIKSSSGNSRWDLTTGEFITEGGDTATGLRLKDGVISATKGGGNTGASITVGADGNIWFNGNVGLNGGTTANYKYVSGIDLQEVSTVKSGAGKTITEIYGVTAATDLSGGGISLSGGKILLSGGGVTLTNGSVSLSGGGISVSTKSATFVTGVQSYNGRISTTTATIQYVSDVKYSTPSVQYTPQSAGYTRPTISYQWPDASLVLPKASTTCTLQKTQNYIPTYDISTVQVVSGLKYGTIKFKNGFVTAMEDGET